VFGATAMRTRRYHARRSPSLALGRLRRALRRQWLPALAVASVIAALGLLYQSALEPIAPPSVLFWVGTGAAIGLGAAIFRELGRNTVTSLSSLGKHRGYAVLGAAPALSPRTLRELAPDQRTPLGCLIFQPAAPFATAFRDLQGALVGDQIVSFIAPLPREGASTAALCTAVSAAQQGRRVMLIDCDVRHRTFTTALEYEPAAGVLEACAEPENWRDYIDEEEETGLHFIPAARPQNHWNTLLSAPGFPILLDQLRDAYDLIVLDCPPALGSADGPAVARLADKCVVVASWDETPLSALRDTMRALRARLRAATGVYVNRVPAGYRFGRLRPD
jgi:Mrp family chromosome partitioning ATPase